ncbi:potassium channel protein [Methanoculleus sp. YWC-01]|uniref:Potassium channel protein n=1 Tax=Methanoculleus nereidis TaxID=2735141 RepID=A0ABU3Z2W3_9EURY|nr:potassium channel family protein [Methanoculleus sp. YWC-01]MCK9297873.1 potassium channel protein [Methanoculleus sp.]MDV4342925.1 potassium channel protein [Methanoculleus sp. YWC-01]PKL56460.1 MAG: potassium channel protein [Methanomicrobiales archaeon HGW-Methanomicrobiales-6]
MMEHEYQPISFKDVLIEMKDVSELMVDLSYSAILFDSKEIALEVINLEERMNNLVYQARIQSVLGARRIEEAEAMSGMLQVAEAAERIANSASDIAKLIIKDIRFPAKLKRVFPEAEEIVTRVIVSQGSEVAGRTLGDLKVQSTTGMQVIAIRRGKGWIYDPDRTTRVESEDILIARGPEAGEDPLSMMAGSGERPRVEASFAGEVDDLDRAVQLIIEMKNLSELSVGLAYTSLLFNNMEVAHEVVALDSTLDDMRYDLDLWILEAARKIEDVRYLRGLLYMSSFAQAISDSAHSIVDVLLRDIEIPPIFKKIVRESDEIITRMTVTPSSPLVGKTLKEMSLATVTGMVVLAIKHGDRWVYRPGKSVRLESGDIIIAKGRRDGECRLYELAGHAAEVSEE